MAATPAQVAKLAAGAHSGTAGVQAYNDAQTQVAKSRDAAIGGLRATAKEAGAPGALTARLSANLAAPGAVSLANLGELGGVARAASDSETSATQNYMNEAGAALPLVRAEADRDLGQKIGLLNASKSGGGGGGRGGVSSLSDSEIKTRLMGLVLQQRQLAATQAQTQNQHAVETALTPDKDSTWGDAGGVGAQLFSQNDNSLEKAIKAAVPSDGGPARPQPQSTYDAQQRAIQAAIAAIQQRQYGPGLNQEAVALAPFVGIDPGLATGIFTPQVEANFLSENKKLGLYQDPNQQSLSGQTLDPMAAAKTLGYDDNQAQRAASAQHWIFSDPNAPAFKAISAWVKANPGAVPKDAPVDDQGLPVYSMMTPEQQAKAQEAFRATPLAKNVASSVVGDVLADAHRAAVQGLDYRTWQINLMATPEYRYDPDAFKLGFAQAGPLFQYAAAVHTRQASAPDPAVYDATAADPFGG